MKSSSMIGAIVAIVVFAVLGSILAIVFVIGGAQEVARSCSPASSTSPVNVAAGDIDITGGVSAPINEQITVAQANIPTRSGTAGFRSSMPRVLSKSPDFVTLNEMAGRSLALITSAAPGYAGYRDRSVGNDPGAGQTLDTAVLWRSDTWRLLDGGRVKIVEDDRTKYQGRPVVWDRFATWSLLGSRTSGSIVAIISVHHMTNPAKYGPDRRKSQYGKGMDTLNSLVAALGAHGPVFIGGDFNVHTYDGGAWTAPAKMATVGYAYTNTSVDYVFYPRSAGVEILNTWQGSMVSDHNWLAAEFAMNGTGPTNTAVPTTPKAAPVDDSRAALRVASRAVAPGLPQQVGDYSGVQLENAAEIIRAGAALGVPLKGQVIAVMTAMGESGLRVLTYGDTVGPDSRGLFQQRDNGAWGSLSDRLDPFISATNFFRALLAVPDWETLAPTIAAHTVQRNADPYHYEPYYAPALEVVAAISDSAGSLSAQILGAGGTTNCDAMMVSGSSTVVYPVPADLISSDNENWGGSGANWTSWHTGTDFSLPCGTPVLAANGGTVEIDTSSSWAGTWLVKISVGPGQLTTWYAHMQSLNVSAGQSVVAGQPIGEVGDLGNATGCHLHFEVHTAGGTIYGPDNVNPTTWLAQNVGSSVPGAPVPANQALSGRGGTRRRQAARSGPGRRRSVPTRPATARSTIR